MAGGIIEFIYFQNYFIFKNNIKFEIKAKAYKTFNYFIFRLK